MQNRQNSKNDKQEQKVDIKANFELEYKNKHIFEDDVTVMMDIDSIVIKTRRNKNKKIAIDVKSLNTQQMDKDQNQNQDQDQESVCRICVKFVNILSVAKNCKDANTFKIVMFTTNHQLQQEEYIDEQDEEQQDQTQSSQLQQIKRIQLGNHVELLGAYTLTLAFNLVTQHSESNLQTSKMNNLQRLQGQISDIEYKLKAITKCEQIYEQIVTKLNEIDSDSHGQINPNSNKGIFGLLAAQNEQCDMEEQQFIDQPQLEEQMIEFQNDGNQEDKQNN